MYFGAAKAKCTLVILVIGLSFSLLAFPRTECICSRDFQSFGLARVLSSSAILFLRPYSSKVFAT